MFGMAVSKYVGMVFNARGQQPRLSQDVADGEGRAPTPHYWMAVTSFGRMALGRWF